MPIILKELNLMNNQYNYIKKHWPAQPRSSRRKLIGESASGSNNTTVITGSGSQGGVTSHSELINIVSTADEYSEFANDIHLTAPDADALKRLAGVEIIESTMLGETIPTDKNIYSALSTDCRITKELGELLVDIDGMYLRKDIDDRAHGIITFDKKIGSATFLKGDGGKGWEILETGAALLDSAQIRSDIYLGGKIGSPSFASGFTGWGWEIDTPTASGTVDNWTVRKSMKVYELVYSQIYGLSGTSMVTDFNKIKDVTSLGDNRYQCTIDNMDGEMFMNLRAGDIVRLQKRDGWNIRYYYAEVESVTTDIFNLKVIDGEAAPVAGDVAFRMGSKTNKNRQGLIYMTSSDDYAPYIDVLDEIKGSRFTEDNTKVRIGNLRGIRVNGQPLDMYGIYINGGIFQHSTYYMDDGNTIEQQFVIMDGKLNSSIEEIRKDISDEKGNILRNSSFASNLNYWNASAIVHFINTDNGYLYLNDNFYTEKDQVADIYRDGTKNVLRIKQSEISQLNGVMNIPPHKDEEDLKTYSFSLYYKVLRSGTCELGIPGTELFLTEQLTESDSYQKISKIGKWNGRGDFKLKFTGEILIYGVSMFSDEMSDAIIKLETKIEQTSEYIKLLATKDYVDAETNEIYTHYNSQLSITAEQISGISTKVDNVNNKINTAGWITNADGVKLFAQEFNKTGVASSISQLNVKYNSISASVSGNEQNISAVRDLANSAANEATKALTAGVYGQEQYSQTSNPWNSWQSGTEYKHVGALWYNPSTGVTQRYTGTTGGNNWETVPNSVISAASYVLQNKDKWSLVVANFDSNGKPTESSGIVTTAYGNSLWVQKGGIISSINQSAESISINARKINLNGAFTANNTFKIDTSGFATMTGGKIASFNIGTDAITISKNNIYSGFGINTAPGTLGLNVPLWIRNHASSDTCIAAYFEAAGASDPLNNIALSIKGAISGLSLKVRRISATVTLDNNDVWVSCYNQSSIGIYLPSGPTVGKLIYLKNINGNNISINGNGKSINANNTVNSIASGTRGEIVMLVYDGQYWIAGYIKW